MRTIQLFQVVGLASCISGGVCRAQECPLPEHHVGTSSTLTFATQIAMQFSKGDHTILGGTVEAWAEAFSFGHCDAHLVGDACILPDDRLVRTSCLELETDADVILPGGVANTASADAFCSLGVQSSAVSHPGGFSMFTTNSIGAAHHVPCYPNAVPPGWYCDYDIREWQIGGTAAGIAWHIELESTGPTPATMAISVDVVGGGTYSSSSCSRELIELPRENTSVAFVSVDAVLTHSDSSQESVLVQGVLAVDAELTSTRLGVLNDPAISISMTGGSLAISGEIEIVHGLDLSDVASLDVIGRSDEFELDGNLTSDRWDDDTPKITWSDRRAMVSARGSSLNTHAYNPRGDFDVDGDVDSADFQTFNGFCGAIDVDEDHDLDNDDYFAYLALYAAADPTADLTGDGTLNSDDFFEFLALFAAETCEV